MTLTSVKADGGLEVHLLDGRSAYPIEASELVFRPTQANGGHVHHVAKREIQWEADEDRPAAPTNIEITVVENSDGDFVELRASCSGWFRKEENAFVLDANVISDGLKIAAGPLHEVAER